MRYRRPLRYGTIAMAIILFSCMLTLYLSGQGSDSPTQHKAPLSSRDYSETPFDTYDATLACRNEAREQLGSSLVRTHTDWHSTRFESDRQTYLVALQANVGTLDIFEEAYIYCYIDPKDYVVTYFKAYDSKQRPLLSSFSFGDFINAFSPSPNTPVKTL